MAFLQTIFHPISSVKNAVLRIQAKKREKAKSAKRSPKWDDVRDAFLKSHPNCAACGGNKELQVHHKVPFHLHPELELEVKNLIVLCMAEFNCHAKIGHGGNFKYYNPDVTTCAAAALRHPDRRKLLEEMSKSRRLRD